jgi:2,4-diaminopentanoate dehydrogenase
MRAQKYRVVQWGTGHTGASSLRSIIQHPDLELVGVYVYTAEKVGQDAGELCGINAVGVVATNEIEQIFELKPDCVMYMPLLDHESVDDMCHLLESGSNIVTTITTLHHADSIEPGTRKRIEAACDVGRTSIYDTGSCPGFITEIVPLALTLMERRLERFTIEQFANLETRKSKQFLGKFFGIDPVSADHDDGAERSARTDGASLRQIAASMSIPIDDMTADSTTALATKTVELDALTLKAGTVGAWRQKVIGYRHKEPLFEYSRTMYVTKDLDPDWNVQDTGWRVLVSGDVPMEMDLRFSTDDYGGYSPGINANLPVNSVIAVCQAEPGIVTTAQLRMVPNLS